MPIHKHLHHLSKIWINDPIYFITTCTYHRRAILTDPIIARILIEDWSDAYERYNWMIGRYVIMPDHVHFFCAYVPKKDDQMVYDISKFMQQWKQWTSKKIIRETHAVANIITPPIWQKEFFDHILRSEESYSQKWEYVYQNPVRKNLVEKAEDWLWQGKIYDLSV